MKLKRCMDNLTCLRIIPFVLLVFSHLPRISAQNQEPLSWEIKTLVIDSNEGIDVADFNNDGQIDVVAGRNWFAAPDFIPRPVRTIEDWNGYVLSNGDFAFDVNHDGWMDVIAGAFNLPEVYWYENPGQPALEQGKLWKKHLLIKSDCVENEGQALFDLNQDGKPEWVVSSWNSRLPFVAWEFSVDSNNRAKVKRIVINERTNGHGLGFGDINGDGFPDLLFEFGWFESPGQNPFDQTWKLHEDWKLHASLPMLVRDIDQDGDSDILVGNAHDYGLFWWEQDSDSGETGTSWTQHLIDDSFSQPHSLHMADLDGDQKEELVVGKRVLAHNGKDPGGTDPPCIYYYEWDLITRSFERFTINEGRVGGGLQIRTADLNGDSRLDIAVAGKSGTYILFNGR